MFSIFTACCYISDAENKMICESVIITNELSDHSRAAAITRVLTVIGIWEKNISIYYWKLTLLYGVMAVLHSSGSDSVFNCYQVLIHLWALRGAIMKNITAKSLRMALEELQKIAYIVDVLSGKCVIDTPKQFAEHNDKPVEGTTSLYLSA